MSWTKPLFIRYLNQPRALIAQHLRLNDEPLHLALALDPGRDPDDPFLFELVGNFGGGRVSQDRELFEVTFGTTSGFPLDENQRLHLILTNPVELNEALQERWPSVEEIRDAVHRGDFVVPHQDQIGKQYLGLL